MHVSVAANAVDWTVQVAQPLAALVGDGEISVVALLGEATIVLERTRPFESSMKRRPEESQAVTPVRRSGRDPSGAHARRLSEARPHRQRAAGAAGGSIGMRGRPRPRGHDSVRARLTCRTRAGTASAKEVPTARLDPAAHGRTGSAPPDEREPGDLGFPPHGKAVCPQSLRPSPSAASVSSLGDAPVPGVRGARALGLGVSAAQLHSGSGDESRPRQSRQAPWTPC